MKTKTQTLLELWLEARTRFTNPVFQKVLDKYFQGSNDQKTLELLNLSV